jgi:hypothetical protein
MSASTSARIVGAAEPPVVGPANTVFAVWLSNVTPMVPDVVTGELATSKIDEGIVRPTLVTVPDPPPPPPPAGNWVVSTDSTPLLATNANPVKLVNVVPPIVIWVMLVGVFTTPLVVANI